MITWGALRWHRHRRGRLWVQVACQIQVQVRARLYLEQVQPVPEALARSPGGGRHGTLG